MLYILGKAAYNYSLCNLSSIKIMILKKYLLTAFREKLKKKILRKAIKSFWIGPVLGGLVGARQTKFF